MTMEQPPFEDVFPIEHGGFSNVMLVFRGVIIGIIGIMVLLCHFSCPAVFQQFQAECPFTTNAQTSRCVIFFRKYLHMASTSEKTILVWKMQMKTIIFQFLHQMPGLFHQSNMYPWDERYIYLHWSHKNQAIHVGVSKNNGTPKSSSLIGFSIIFTIHFGG